MRLLAYGVKSSPVGVNGLPMGILKKRLLFLRRTPGYGGSEVVILNLLHGIDYEKNDVQLATTTDVFSPQLSKLGLPVEIIPIERCPTGSALSIFAFWLRFLERLRPQKIILAEGGFCDFPVTVVFAANIVAPGHVYRLALHPAPEPPMKTSRMHWGFVPGIGLWWYCATIRYRLSGLLTRRTLAVSYGIREKLVRGYGFPELRTGVVYHGVDTSVFSPASSEGRRVIRAAWRIPEDATVLASTARLDPIKRLDRLINAFSTLCAARNDVWLLLTGEGPLRAELQSLSRSVGVAGRVRFLGQVPDVRPVLQASDIYVLPSDEEGFGIALAEAMACKLVCIATETVGPREIIEDGKTGFLVDRTCEGVVSGLRKALVLSREQREIMTTAARQKVIERFNLACSVAGSLEYLEIDRAKDRLTHEFCLE